MQTVSKSRSFNARSSSVLLFVPGLCLSSILSFAQESRLSGDDPVFLNRNSDGRLSIVINGMDQRDIDSVKIQVWPGSVDPDTLPSIAGTLKKQPDRYEFVPRFPFLSGRQYRVRVSIRGKVSDYFVEVPSQNSARTNVVAVYPSNRSIPANLLKFYVYFSTPMRKGDVYEYVKLQTSAGVEIDLPFLQIEQELWSRDSLRLTLLLDPGRIKRGLKPRKEMGPIFEAGRKYQLVIDGRWPDGRGIPLGKDHIQEYETHDEDHSRPNPENWRIQKPIADSSDPVRIRLEGPLDYAMLQRVFEIKSSRGILVDGKWTVSTDAANVSFFPAEAWATDNYTLCIDSNLEDLAGNSIGRQFDVDMFDRTESSSQRAILEMPFRIDRQLNGDPDRKRRR